MRALKLLFYSRSGQSSRWIEALHQALPGAEIRLYGEATSDWQADYALLWQPPPELLRSQRRLRGIFNLGAGVDALLANPGLPEEVPIYKLRDAGMAAWMLDYIRYGLLHFGRDMDRYREQQRLRCWQPREIGHRAQWPVGVLGLGALGSEIAAALSVEGYSVSGWSRTPKSIPGVDCYAGETTLAPFLSRCRVLVSILPATVDTRHLLNLERLQRLPEGAVVISCGRGEVLDSQALLALLDSHHLRGALLDVFEQEPLPTDSPLYDNERLIITPHISAPTPIEGAIEQIVEGIGRLESGAPLPAVDRQRGY
ncbi:2-hydroxyacid dehydrogenase [Aestuariirhabdus litorea]|uniref:2-hydroxyacid dehydrogenase n=1 Tax=Aestuariirhabdus litorea TaxID=2528527 RepID=UPI001FB1F0E6|nr:glyoxylate/hydroxypyruvate reductase A [Aestuariirhabdus litorea]